MKSALKCQIAAINYTVKEREWIVVFQIEPALPQPRRMCNFREVLDSHNIYAIAILAAGNESLFLDRQYLPFAFCANRVDAHDAGITRLMSKSAIVLRVTAKRRLVAD